MLKEIITEKLMQDPTLKQITVDHITYKIRYSAYHCAWLIYDGSKQIMKVGNYR